MIVPVSSFATTNDDILLETDCNFMNSDEFGIIVIVIVGTVGISFIIVSTLRYKKISKQ